MAEGDFTGGADFSGATQQAEIFTGSSGTGGSEIPAAEPDDGVYQTDGGLEQAAQSTEQEAQTETTQAETQPQVTAEEAAEIYELFNGEKVPLTKADVKFLVRHGAKAFIEAQQALQRQMDGGAQRAQASSPPRQVQPQPSQGEPNQPPELSKFEQYTKKLEARLEQMEAREAERARLEADRQLKTRAQQIKDGSLQAIQKNKFFTEDWTPEEQAEFHAEAMMLQGLVDGMTPEEAVDRLHKRYEKKIQKAAEKWKVGKIQASGNKVEGGGATHPTPKPKFNPHDFYNGNLMKAVLNFGRGSKSE